MNFLLIANNDHDGVGQVAINLCKNLISKRHKSKLIVLHKNSNNNFIKKIKRSLFARIFLYILEFFKKKTFRIIWFWVFCSSFSRIKKIFG